jgi:D-alanyl-D-alanine carboxypeptidase/D-alanyl-D-alanine-endopeptidase (penicillin-binding protein 4)
MSVNSVYAQRYPHKKILRDLENLSGFEQAYVGFQLYDPEKNKVIASHLEEKYMTPASNTKLFTFYTGLQILDDAVPAMLYTISGDSLIFWGSGNPLFLHPEIGDTTVLEFLRGRKEQLFYWARPTNEDRFGPGWGWDDYEGYYSAEKSIFPIYGNSTWSYINRAKGSITVFPKRLKNDFSPSSDTVTSTRNSIQRAEFLNDFDYKIGLSDSIPPDTLIIEEHARPFIYSDDLFRKLLSDTLKKAVRQYEGFPNLKTAKTLFGLPIDTLYKNMLQPSDNLFAEQILMMASDQLTDTLNTSNSIDYMLENYFTEWQDELVWVDGSGLSRYNMFTPRTIVHLLDLLRDEVGEERLFELLPAGGISGTIEDWYGSEAGPYVFAKTGTVRNNHCLSGYIKTKKGKTLIFTFMVNHYTSSTSEVKKSMQQMLEKIRNAY